MRGDKNEIRKTACVLSTLMALLLVSWFTGYLFQVLMIDGENIPENALSIIPGAIKTLIIHIPLKRLVMDWSLSNA